MTDVPAPAPASRGDSGREALGKTGAGTGTPVVKGNGKSKNKGTMQRDLR